MIKRNTSYWIILFFSFWIVNSSTAQQSENVDSLINLLKTQEDDSSRLMIQIRLFQHFYKTDTTEANYYLFNITNEIENRQNEIPSYLINNVGRLFEDYKADFNEAIKYYTLATDKAREENDLHFLDYQAWLGYTLSRMGDTEQGLKYLLNVVETVESRKLNTKIPKFFLLLAFVYRNAENFDKAEYYFNKCIEASQHVSDSTKIHTALHELGNIFLMKSNYEQALIFHKHALNLRMKEKNNAALMYSYNDIAQDYLYLDSLDLAMEYFLKAREIALQQDEILTLFHITNGIIAVLLIDGQLNKVQFHLEEAQKLADKLKLKVAYYPLNDSYYKYFKSINQYEKALKYYELAIAYKDSISNDEVKKNISELDKKYETAKKDKELLKRQESIKRQQLVITFIAFGVLLLVVFVIVVFRSYKQKKSAYAQLEIQNQEIMQQREEITLAKNEAEKSNFAKSEFLSRMSHELRTPMNSILGFAQLLQYGELNAGQKKGVNHILKSGKHLLDLINEVLDISRIEAGRLSLSIEPVQVNRVISEIVDIVKPIASDRQLTITYKNEHEDTFFVKADNKQLKQVLLNLLNNAVKYNVEYGLITVKVSRINHNNSTDYSYRISITDTGVGISEQNIPKLFTPFERIGQESSNIEGTGLGLAVTKKLIDAMNGQIGVESIKDKGSTFWIELPHCDSQIENTEKKLQLIKSETPHSKKGSILYIEDNPSNVELVEQILANQRPGIQLFSNPNGKLAVSLAINFSPDLILLDLNLPDIHGFDVINNLLSDERTKTIPVVIVSADAMPTQIQRLLNAGAKEYIAKPLNIVEFLNIIDKFLDKSENI